jgi:uncharacterized protein with HEPN domain
VYLKHILEAIGYIEEYLHGVSRQEFLQTHMLQDAVALQLGVIGEESRKVSEPLRQQYITIPWRQIIALRNRIMYDYFTLNLQIIWEIVQQDLPSFKQQVTQILADLEVPEK